MTSSTKIKFCKKCIMPSTKNDLEFNSEGICSGCTAYNKRDSINWKETISFLLIQISVIS